MSVPTATADLLAASCAPTKQGVSITVAQDLLALVPGWAIVDGKLERNFSFKDYHHTMAFVNALAWISHTQDHHPELVVTYKNCVVRYDTHSVQGLSLNDFICAAKASALVP